MFENALCTGSLPSLTDALDRSFSSILRGDVTGGMTTLVRDLGFACAGWAEDRWASARAYCLEHPIRETLHADPLTLRAFTRGAADGTLLDLAYRHPTAAAAIAALNPTARAIHDWVAGTNLAQAIRWRLVHLAKTIDAAALHRRPRVLAVGAGHLREVELSSAFSRNRLEHLVALDTDTSALSLVARDLKGTCAVPVHAKDLGSLGTFDLIYSGTTFEGLDDDAAGRLASALWSKLAPGGSMVIANLTPVTIERGYMDAFMRWRPQFRTPQALGRVLFRASGAIPVLSEDPYLRVAYARIDRTPLS